MNPKPIALNGFAGQISIIPDAEAQKVALLKVSKPFQAIANDAAQASAIAIVRDLASMRKEVEATRKLIKEPVLKLGKQIDSTASDFISEVTAEEDRIKGLLADYQTLRLQEEREAEELFGAPAAELVSSQPEGLSVKQPKDYRVKGDDEYARKKSLLELAQHDLSFVNIEVRRADVLDRINRAGTDELPGLEIFETIKLNIR